VTQLFKFAAGLALAAAAAFAQDVAFFGPQEDLAKMKMQLEGAVMGGTVKGAPYSGEEVTSNTQVLADGTRIHHESRTTVYRDSEGRVRRETPDQITIMDPVAGASYFLNPKTQTGRKMPMMTNVRVFRSGDGNSVVRTESSFTMTSSRNGDMTATINGNPVDPKTLAEAMARAKADGGPVTLPGEPGQHIVMDRMVTGDKIMLDKMDAEKMAAEKSFGLAYVVTKDRGKSEDLGKSTLEGVAATGTRNTMTIDTGAIGNDRPIQTITERWYSPELQTVISTKTTDPRTGEMTFQLTNIRRDEPASYLFQVPAGYTINDRK